MREAEGETEAIGCDKRPLQEVHSGYARLPAFRSRPLKAKPGKAVYVLLLFQCNSVPRTLLKAEKDALVSLNDLCW